MTTYPLMAMLILGEERFKLKDVDFPLDFLDLNLLIFTPYLVIAEKLREPRLVENCGCWMLSVHLFC